VRAKRALRHATTLGTPRTASRIRGSGCRRRAGARLLLAGDNTFEDGLVIIHYCRLGDLLRVVCDKGGRAHTDTALFCFKGLPHYPARLPSKAAGSHRHGVVLFQGVTPLRVRG